MYLVASSSCFIAPKEGIRLLALGLVSPSIEDLTEVPFEGNVGFTGVLGIEVEGTGGVFAFRPGKRIVGKWGMGNLINKIEVLYVKGKYKTSVVDCLSERAVETSVKTKQERS